MFCEHNSKARKPGLCAKCSDLKPYTVFKYCKKQCFSCNECGWFYGSGASDELVGRPVIFGPIKAEKDKSRPIKKEATDHSLDTWEGEGGSFLPHKEAINCLECMARKKNKPALSNRLWCADHTPEHCIETDKKKYKPVIKPSPWDLLKEWQKELDENKVANTPIKPDPIIFVHNFGSWVGEWRVGRKGRQAIEDVYRQYKLSASSR